MTFFSWLRKQRIRNDAIGDLARDVMRDKEFPRGSQIRKARKYIEENGRPLALDALNKAHREWCEIVGFPYVKFTAADIEAEVRSYPAIFIQAAIHLQRERDGESPCTCDSCNTVRKALKPLDYGSLKIAP
jgi:uncharacterized protein YozE (UPF0346 family)